MERKSWTGIVECCICWHRSVQTAPLPEGFDEPITALKCEKCGAETARPTHSDPEQGLAGSGI